MIVCHCLGMTDRELREAARQGARTARDLGHRVSAGTFCGGCRPAIEEILREAARNLAAAPSPAAPRP